MGKGSGGFKGIKKSSPKIGEDFFSVESAYLLALFQRPTKLA